jgi:hypothetical protein
MERLRSYRYFAKPLTDNTNEMLAAKLSALNSEFDSETQKIKVDGKWVYGVYQVTHTILTELSHSEAHRQNIRAYVQEGEGATRPYPFYKSKRSVLASTKELKRVNAMLTKLKEMRLRG